MGPETSEGTNCGAMESEKPSKTQNAPGFHARAGPGMATPPRSFFWAEKLILVIINQFLLRKATKNIISLHVSSIQLSIARFLGDPAHLNRPGLTVDRFSIVKKHIFINTNNVKGFYCSIAGSTAV
jgi:hypothetical protein